MNQLRFRSGQVQLRKVRVNSNTEIEAGDLLWLDGDDAKPASDFAWTVDHAQTQAAFAAKFLGVAHQPSAVGDNTPISVDASSESVYEFDAASSNYELGTPLGPDANANVLTNQQFKQAASDSAIARSAEFTTSATNKLRVTFASAFNTNSSNVNAALG